MVRLTISYNNEHLKTYELDTQSITVGRLPENTISIANMGISRRHFQIELDAARNYIVSDLNSLNGTYVNNAKVKSSQLSSGDMITIGKYGLLFEVVDAGQAATPPPPVPSVAAASKETRTVAKEDTSSVKIELATPIEEALSAVPDEADRTSKQSGTGIAGIAAAEKSPEIPPEPKEEFTATSIARRDLAAAEAGGVSVLIETTKHVVYKLDKPTVTLGSSESDDIYVSGFMIGDEHVVVEKKEDGVWIRANKMMGKFKVNGQKAKQHRLEHKDRIEVGNSTFRYMENE